MNSITGKLFTFTFSAIKCKMLTPVYINKNQIFRSYAARKGTREKARKKKVKVEVKKIGFIPHNQRMKDQLGLSREPKRLDDSWRQIAVDNVWVQRYNRLKVYSFEEAVACHRETHHPTMYNVPHAQINAIIELDMRAEKKNRFIDDINRICGIPHPFNHGEERTVLAFAKGKDVQAEAIKAGATLVGGSELIQQIQNGDIVLRDFQYSVAHPNILSELVTLRGLMKKKFPNQKHGSLGPDLYDIVQKFMTGIRYSAVKDEFEQDYAAINVSFGTLNMETKHLEENLMALLTDLNSIRPKREGLFITRCFLESAPSKEKLKISLDKYNIIESLTEEETNDEALEKSVASN